MLFDSIFKKKKQEISKDLFGEKILSRILLSSAQKSPDLYEELGIEMTFTHYLFYLEYLLFLAGKVLEQQYSSADIKAISYSAINGIVDLMEMVPLEKKGTVKSVFLQMYSEFEHSSESICSNITSENGLRTLADSFIVGCGKQKGLLSNVLVFAHFSEFVISHSGEILDDNVVLI